MSRSRLLTLILSVALFLALVLGLVNTLIQLYAGLLPISPGLARGAIAIVVGLVIILLTALVYYARLFLRPQRRSPRPVIPTDKTAAAAESLRAVQQQAEQLENEIARQAVLERSRQIEQQLSRGALQVVVFGTGSAGKTSIVNAIVGRMVGKVGAAIGTTAAGTTHRFRLREIDREIRIIDTPGILEAGIRGTEREHQARSLATTADLLIFVLEGDLRRSEYEPLRSLVDLGKRSLVVFNKIDRYPPADVEAILARLQQRLQGLIAAADVVAIAANPVPVVLANGEQVQPQPQILPLLERMAAILRSEGDTLIADNILLQAQRLGDEARQLLDQQRQQQAEAVVDRFQWIGAGVVAVTPLPVVDLLATAAVNAQMVVEIGQVYGCEMNLDRGKELALSLSKTLISLGLVRGAIEILSIALQTNVSTFLLGRAIQGATAAYLTRIAGKSFIKYFRQNQDWGDGGISQVVEEQFQLNRRDQFIQGFVRDTIARVVKPITPEA
jgi:hypothetical protein